MRTLLAAAALLATALAAWNGIAKAQNAAAQDGQADDAGGLGVQFFCAGGWRARRGPGPGVFG